MPGQKEGEAVGMEKQVLPECWFGLGRVLELWEWELERETIALGEQQLCSRKEARLELFGMPEQVVELPQPQSVTVS